MKYLKILLLAVLIATLCFVQPTFAVSKYNLYSRWYTNLGPPSEGLLLYAKPTTDIVGISSLNVTAGDPTDLTTCTWNFPDNADTRTIDTALGGDVLFDSSDSMAPFVRSYKGWTAQLWANQSYLWIGTKGVTGYSADMGDYASRFESSLGCLTGFDRLNYSPDESTNGYIRDYGTGNLVPFATGMVLGKQAVVEGDTYILYMGVALGMRDVIYCWAADGTFLGIDSAALLPPVNKSLSADKKTLQFTIPHDSGIAYIDVMAVYATHTAEEFDATIASMNFSIKSQYYVIIDSGYAYIRTEWDTTSDLVQKVAYTGSGYNDVVNFGGAKLIPIATTSANTITAFSTGTVLSAQGDEGTPVNYNGTYIGGNHGANKVHQVTATSHGKAVEDVGSQWLSGDINFTILKIVDVDTLWLMSDSTGGDQWVFNTTSLSGVDVTHVSGATNTGTFTPSADTITQLTPAVKTHTKRLEIDGVTIIADGTYEGHDVSIFEYYEICNPQSVIDYVQSVVGGASQPDLNHISIDTDSMVSNTFNYGINGAMSLNTRFTANSNLLLNYTGFIQAQPLEYTAKTMLQYVDKLDPIVGGLKTWDFTATEDITSTIETILTPVSSWVDSAEPPDRAAQIVKDGATKEFGQVVGYSTENNRVLLIDDAFYLSPSRKMYPKAVTGSAYPSDIIPTGTTVSNTSYKSIYNFDKMANSTVATWYNVSNGFILVLDIHQNVTAEYIQLPGWMVGKAITVLDKSSSLTVHDGVIGVNGVSVSVTGGYGQATIKVGD